MILVAAIAVAHGSSPGHAGDLEFTIRELQELMTKLASEYPGPLPEVQTTTDPESQELQIYEGRTFEELLEDFRGLVFQSFYNEATLAPSTPEGEALIRLEGTYIPYFLVFDSAGDAKKFRKADIKDVVAGGQLEKVRKFKNGAILDDGEGHINVMFNVENVVVDIRIGVTESQPGEGVDQAKDVADLIFEALKEED
jgi:hypothetical protein